MCGIVGFLDKRGGSERPVGKTLLAMLQALSCRGPDSAGVAVFGPAQPNWVARVVLAGETGLGSDNRITLHKLGGHGHVIHYDIEGA
jgi:glutamate synthase domain-containing protein 1